MVTTYQNRVWDPVAELLDNGNFVVRNEEETDPDAYVWQSFDYPSDTLLTGMKLGWDLRTGMEQKITSWRSPDNPSPGDFSWDLMLYNYPEFYLMNGTQKFYRIGPWNELHFSGVSNQNSNWLYELKHVSNKDDMFYSYTLKNNSEP